MKLSAFHLVVSVFLLETRASPHESNYLVRLRHFEELKSNPSTVSCASTANQNNTKLLFCQSFSNSQQSITVTQSIRVPSTAKKGAQEEQAIIDFSDGNATSINENSKAVSHRDRCYSEARPKKYKKVEISNGEEAQIKESKSTKSQPGFSYKIGRNQDDCPLLSRFDCGGVRTAEKRSFGIVNPEANYRWKDCVSFPGNFTCSFTTYGQSEDKKPRLTDSWQDPPPFKRNYDSTFVTSDESSRTFSNMKIQTCLKTPISSNERLEVGNMCTIGADAGCACDQSEDPQECPKEEKQPACADEKCVPDKDNKCTKDHAGCACKQAEEKEKCPEYELVLRCEDCGGTADFDDPTCLGDPKDNYRWKGCECMDWGSYKVCSYGPLTDADRKAIDDDWDNAIRLTSNNTKNLKKDDTLCQKAGWEAPQRDNDGSPSISSAAATFCREQDGKSVTKQPIGVDRVFRMFPYAYYSYFLWAGTRYNPAENKCGDTNKISKDECEAAILSAMMACDPSSGVSHGASKNGSCITYAVELDGGHNPISPPWNRITAKSKPQCDPDAKSGLENPLFQSLQSLFCSEVEG